MLAHPLLKAATKRFASKEEQADFIEEKFREILEALGLDLSQPSLRETPSRVAQSYVYELFAGLDEDNFPEMTLFDADAFHGESSTLLISDIALTSTCEHHLLPFFGKVHIAYKPSQKVLGLSKIHRLVRYFAARPQMQERLTAQIADMLSLILETDDVAVCISAQHTCVCCRGVRDEMSAMRTTHLMGAFKEKNPFKYEKDWEEGKPDSVSCL